MSPKPSKSSSTPRSQPSQTSIMEFFSSIPPSSHSANGNPFASSSRSNTSGSSYKPNKGKQRAKHREPPPLKHVGNRTSSADGSPPRSSPLVLMKTNRVSYVLYLYKFALIVVFIGKEDEAEQGTFTSKPAGPITFQNIATSYTADGSIGIR